MSLNGFLILLCCGLWLNQHFCKKKSQERAVNLVIFVEMLRLGANLIFLISLEMIEFQMRGVIG